MSKVPSLLTLSAVLCAGAAFAEGESVYRVVDDTTLEVTVPAGFTNEFDATYAAALNDNTYAAFVKKGAGGLYMPNDISAFTGTVDVDEGSLGCRKSTSLGALSLEAGAVTVKDGATLFIPDNNTDSGVKVNSVNLSGKRLVIAGFGVNGAGAVDLRSEQQNNPLGQNVLLSANARVRNRTQYFWGRNGIRCECDLDGHDLYLFSEGSSPAFQYVDVKNPGNVFLESSGMGLTGTKFGGSAENKLTVMYKSGNTITLAEDSTDAPSWTLVRETESGTVYIHGATQSYNANTRSYPGVSTNLCAWKGPVLLKGTGLVNFQSPTAWHGGIALLGKVSGTARSRVWGNDYLDGTTHHHPYLNLVSSENDFTGAMTLRFGGLRLWNPGALPSAVPLTLEEGEVCFDNLCEDFGTLSPMTVDCTGYTRQNIYNTFTNDVRFGRGKWQSVTKNGPERLLWYSGTGANVVKLNEGFLKLGRRPKIAGLYSWQTNSYYSSTMKNDLYAGGIALKTDLEPGVRSPNCYLTHAHGIYNYKLDPTKANDAQYAVTVYHGYVWNNDPTNVTWSFAGGGLGSACKLSINGETVFEFDVSSQGSPQSYAGNAVLHPGANTFDFRGFRTYRADSCVVRSRMTGAGWTWPSDDFNFGYDPLGRGSKNCADYQRMEDPGDGSLFTFALPDEEYVYPRHEDEAHSGVQTDFDEIQFADGTGLDLTDVTNYVASSIQGYPILKNATAFGVTNRWTVGVETLGAKKLTTDGTLDLSQATIVVDESKAKMGRGSLDFEIATAAGGIVGTPEVIGVERCSTRLSADGKTLCLHHEPKGVLLIIR